MNDLKDRSNDIQYFGALEKRSISFSISDVKKAVPRVNFKKIKLNKFQNLDNIFERKNITRISLDDGLLGLNLPIKRVVREEGYESTSINPLRKKIEQEEEREQEREGEREVETEEKPAEEKPEEAPPEKEKKDITFNLEAQIVQEEENIIISPAIISLPPFKEDMISTSGEQPTFAWPPIVEKKAKKKKPTGRQKFGQKKKPYFITEKKQEVKKKKQESEVDVQEEKTKRKIDEKGFDAGSKFPWTTTASDYQLLEDVIEGGLESRLLDIPADKVIDESKTHFIKENIAFKALIPQIPAGVFSETVSKEVPGGVKSDNVFSQTHKRDYGIEFVRKASNMFEKYGNYLTPIRIVILGGLTATLGYLLWTYISPDLRTLLSPKEEKDRFVVKDLFKKTHGYKKELSLGKEQGKIQKKESEEKKEEESIFKPITEQERLALVQRARESLETRSDPFGQEAVLPSRVIENKIKQKSEEDKPPPDIPLLRKQVELVGVISTDSKNIALVNVYIADYTVSPSDDKTTRETKLKTALSMAVPDRIELSLLDPVEDWYVKQITKSKSRSEDPTIELVKGDKKFKLRVGQRVLLPEEKKAEEMQEDVSQKIEKNSTKK